MYFKLDWLLYYTRNSRRFAPFFLALEGASRPSSKLIVNMFSLCTSKNKIKIIRGFSQKISRIFKIFKNLMTIEFWWRQIFEILIFHKPSLGCLDVPQKIWARSVQPFWRLLDTNKQTNRQAKFIYRSICKSAGLNTKNARVHGLLTSYFLLFSLTC